MFNRAELKTNAKVFFKGNYWKCVLAGLLAVIAAGAAASSSTLNSDDLSEVFTPEFVTIILAAAGVTSIAAILVKIFALNPLKIGCNSFFINNTKCPASLTHLGDGFSNNYIGNVKTIFLMDLFTVLWTLLFIIPGIIKAYEYRMIPYLIAENPELTTKEAFAKSKEMMKGNKWAAFVLDLSFIGWELLTALTVGILGLFWTNPYVEQTNANLYLALKSTVTPPEGTYYGQITDSSAGYEDQNL